MIASLGESLIDFTPLEFEDELTGFELHPGGSPFNVAVAVARLGYPAAFVGTISTDLFGGRLLRALEDEGVDTSFVVRAAEPTTLAFVAYEGGEAAYCFRGEGTADALLLAEDVNPTALSSLDALHVGSISLAREPIGSTAAELALALRGEVVLLLDPNVRVGVVADWEVYRARLDELARAADVVKASEADFAVWGVHPAELDGPAAVVVTRGPRGSTVYASGTAFAVSAQACEVLDTIGAGDAFTAGLLVGLSRAGSLSCGALGALDADEWRAAVEYAATVSALACERRGAQSPRADEVEARLGRAGQG